MPETEPHELPPFLQALRVDATRASVRHEAHMLAEQDVPSSRVTASPSLAPSGEPDLFSVLPKAVRRAFDLGIRAPDSGYHVFVEASPEVDVLPAIMERARELLLGRARTFDVVYVHDFDAPSSPRPILLPPGAAPMLARSMSELLSTLRTRLPALSTDVAVRHQRVDLAKQLKERQKGALTELETLAKGLGFGIKAIPGGIQSFPILHGKPVSAEQFEILDESTKRHLTEAEEKLSEAVELAAERVRSSTRDIEDAERQLQEKVVRELVTELMQPVLERFADVAEVQEYLLRVADELVVSADDLMPSSQQAPRGEANKRDDDDPADPEIATRLSRFAVNVFVTQQAEEGAPEDADPSEINPEPPVFFEDNPTFAHLFGFLERRVHLGALVSDFMRIRPGSLHRASGGVLVLRAIDLLGDALAWDRLKRVLRARAVGHEDPIGPLGLYATTLRPKPCPIDTRIVLVGPHDLYAQLLEADPDFGLLFRVKVEIMPDIARTPENIAALDSHIVRLTAQRGLGPLSTGARARLLDYACRLTEDNRRLALYLAPLEETIAFATVIAAERAEQERQESVQVEAADVDAAWQERRDRTAGAERELREMVLSGEVLVATEGRRTGVVNGLSVLSAGDVQFGHPMRITAVVSLGNEGVIDVEREASLGGALHTKGVAILRGFLSGTFGQERPVALRAQIAFEQSYGEVEGDSASSSELYAILSAIAEVPIDQGIAVTGSVNQLGEVQAIGGVTAKIEGFFDLCTARGLTGRQGVLIPRSSIPHLVLRDDVAAAIAAGRFHLFAIEQVAQGIEVLTGVPAGARDGSGRFPADSVFGRVERRLIEIAERMRRAEGVPSGDLDEGRGPQEG